MSRTVSRRGLLAAGAVVAAAGPSRAAGKPDLGPVLDYVGAQRTTGFLVVQAGETLVEKNWPLPADAAGFRAAFASYGTARDGARLEDVASQQKSFVAVLAAIAADKGLLDVQRPVADYIGAGWSKAAPDQERAIRVIHLLTMSSGLTEALTFAAPPGEAFLYNTPAYAMTKRVLAAAAGQPLETLTRDWLAAPAGMADTAWRQRPAALADVGNPTGLVSSPRDIARFGQLVLSRGLAAGGRRVVSEAALAALFVRTPTNPAYGRLWWLNGSSETVRPLANRTTGPLIPTAPADLVAALGAVDRKLYIVPSRKLVVVRLGQAAPDKAFDRELWARLSAALA